MVSPSNTNLSAEARRFTRRAVAAALLLAGLVACGTLVEPQEWRAVRGPVVPHDSFPGDCRLCHEGNGWHQIRADFSYDHEQETGVPLKGAHRRAECLRCHNDRGPVEIFAARGCGGCHVDPHRKKLGERCDACHQETDWSPRAAIAEHASTRFPLVGAHAVTACWRCHPGAQVGNFEGLSPDCVSCHFDDLSRTSRPDHRMQGWTDDCQRCHIPLSWVPARFDHPQSFPLTLGHGGLSCHACHGSDPTFGGLSPDCHACHSSEFQTTDDPNHVAAGFGLDCLECHTTATWMGARFDHPSGFPLLAGHAGRRCSECHTGGGFDNTPTDCVACHRAEYDRTTAPNHRDQGFGTDCAICHLRLDSWHGATFNHSFPRTGDHNVSCSDCHTTPGNARAVSCTHCHDHSRAAMEDEHSDVNGYAWSSPDCLRCHPSGR